MAGIAAAGGNFGAAAGILAGTNFDELGGKASEIIETLSSEVRKDTQIQHLIWLLLALHPYMIKWKGRQTNPETLQKIPETPEFHHRLGCFICWHIQIIKILEELEWVQQQDHNYKKGGRSPLLILVIIHQGFKD